MSPPSTDLVGAWNAGEVLFQEAGAWQAGETLFRDPLVKYNPFHDELGRFASGDGGGGLAISAGDDLVGEPVGAGGGAKALTANDLPEGYTLVQEGKNDWVVYHGGQALTFGASPEGALTNYANISPGKMAPGMTTHLDTDDPHNDKPYEIKDATGEVKGKGASYAEALVDAKANGVTLGQQSIVGQLGATTAGQAVVSPHGFTAKDLPPGYTLTQQPNGHWWVTGPDISPIGASTPGEALDTHFMIHPGSALPVGYAIAYNNNGTFSVVDPEGNALSQGSSKLEAVADWKSGKAPTGEVVNAFTAKPATPAAATSAYTPEQLAGVVSEHGFVAGDLGHGAKLVQSGDDWTVQTKGGGTSGVGKTPAEALESHFTIYPSHALDEATTLTKTLDGTGFNVVDVNTDIILGTGATKFEAVADWKQKTMVGETPPNLGDLPETRFGTGAGGGPEALATAGGVGFFTDERDRGHDYANQKYDPNAPIAPAATHNDTPAESSVIASYTGSGNNDINRSLRYGTPPDASITPDRIKTLDGLFRDTATAKATTLYRGIGEHEKQRLEEAIKAGRGHYVDKGFVSTSSSESFAQSWKSGDYIEFHLPPGSPAINVDPHSSHHGEHEWIINRNQIFKFDDSGKVTTFGYGEHKKYTVHLVDQRPPSAKDGEGQLKLPFTPVNNLGKARRKPPPQPYDPADKFSYIGGEIDYLDDDEVNALIRRQQRQPKPATETKKYNEAHDERGRFTTGGGGDASYATRAARFMQRLKGDLELGVEGLKPPGVRQVSLTPLDNPDESPELPMVMPRTPPSGPLVFHGTSEEALASIEEHGLVARGGAGADQWAQAHPEFFSPGGSDPGLGQATVTTFADKPAHLFFAANPETAFTYAAFAAKATGSTPVVIPVHLTHGMADRLVWDTAGAHGEMKLDGEMRIPREWLGKPAIGTAGMTKMLASYYKLPDDYKLNSDTIVDISRPPTARVLSDLDPNDAAVRGIMGKAQGKVIFAVFFLDGTVSKYNENHDERGRFASGEGSGGGGDVSTGIANGRELSPDEKKTAGYYTAANGYLNLNHYLRHDVMSEPSFGGRTTEAHVAALAGAIDSRRLTADTTLYRGFHDSRLVDRLDQMWEQKRGAKEFVDKGFVSTSESASVAGTYFTGGKGEGQYVFAIHAPKGTKALDVSRLKLGSPLEREVILQHGSRFRLDGRERDNTGKTTYKLSLIGAAAKWNPFHDLLGRFASGDGGGNAAPSAPKEYEDPVGTDAPTIPGQDHSKFSFVEKSALSAYTGGSYLQVNNYFRKGRVLSEATATFIERMDSGFAKVAPLAAPMEVYRGLSDHTMARFEQAFAGKDTFEVTDLGYGSTSTSRATAASFGGGAMSNELGLARPGAVATITLPAGSKAMDMVPLSGAPGEQEVLVDRGARYRVERNHGSFGKYKMTLLDQQVKKANP